MGSLKAEGLTHCGDSEEAQNVVRFGGQHDISATTRTAASQQPNTDGLDIPGFLKRPNLAELAARIRTEHVDRFHRIFGSVGDVFVKLGEANQ